MNLLIQPILLVLDIILFIRSNCKTQLVTWSQYMYVHMLETNFNHINLYFRLRKNLFPRFMLMNLHCVSSVLIIFLSNLSVTHTMKRSCQFDGGCEAKKPFLSWRNWDIEPVSNARNVSFGFNPPICQKEIPKFAGVLLVNTSGKVSGYWKINCMCFCQKNFIFRG